MYFQNGNKYVEKKKKKKNEKNTKWQANWSEMVLRLQICE